MKPTIVKVAIDFQPHKPTWKQRFSAWWWNWKWKYDAEQKAWGLHREVRGTVHDGWFYPESNSKVKYRIKVGHNHERESNPTDSKTIHDRFKCYKEITLHFNI